MAITVTSRLAEHKSNDATSYSFGPMTVTAGTWLVIDLYSQRVGAPATPTLSGGGLTYNLEATAYYVGGRKLHRYYAWTIDVTSLTIGVSFGAETQVCCGMAVTELGGVDASDPFVQTVTNGTAGATSGDVTLSAYAHADNRFILSLYHASNEATTEDHTQISDVAGTLENSALSISWHATTQDLTPGCSWTTSVGWQAIGSEVKAAAAGSEVLDPFGMSGFFGA